MKEHRQVEVYNPFYDEAIEVDEGIAPLLIALWERGIQTTLSCQENQPGIIWIEFAGSREVEAFLQLAIPNRRSGMYIDANPDGKWEYSVNVADHSSKGELNFWCAVSVRFPSSQYEKILSNVLQSESYFDLE